MKRKLNILVSVMISAVLLTAPITVRAEGNPYRGSWNNCTWSAWQLVLNTDGIELPQWGNAGNWLNQAAASGYSTGSVPAANSIAVWSGHVAYVADTDGADQVYLMEGGYNGAYNEGWYSASGRGRLYGYIYLSDAPVTYTEDTSYWQDPSAETWTDPNQTWTDPAAVWTDPAVTW